MLEEMLTLYYPPFRADTDDELLETALVALRRYVLELGDFKHEVLDRAWAEVVRDHKVERWPTIGVIVDACEYRGADGKSARFLPGERKGYNGPVRARPDFSYQVENGMMEQDLADRLTARYRAQS